MIPAELRLGERADIICTLRRGDLPVTFRWYFNGREIRGEELGKVTSYDVRSSVYLMDKLRAENVGNYTCMVSNAAGSDTASGQLLVEVPPVWVEEPRDSEVVLGSQVLLTCAATAHPPPRITWRKIQGENGGGATPGVSSSEEGSTFLYSSPRWVVSANGSLLISKAQETDAGLYACHVENGIGPGISKNIALKVNVPPKVSVPKGQLAIRKGEAARLACDVTGNGPINVKWVKKQNVIEIHPGSRFEGNQRRSGTSAYSKQEQYTFELLVRDSQQADGGTYYCIARNDYGEHRAEITLDVLEPSSSPRGVRITEITSRSTRVSWQPPLPRNSPVLKYHVRYWKNGGIAGKQLHQVVLGGSETSTYLEGLHPGTSYSVQVLAENGVGLSEPSQLRHVQTKEEAPSGAPTDVHAHPIGSKQIEVTWKPPPSESWHGVLKGYYLGYKVTSSPLAYVYHTTTDPTGRRFRIKGLQKSTSYSIVVKAYNGIGSGPESQPVEVKTRESDPPYPPSFVITDVTSSSALVQMKSEDMSPVLQYILEYRRHNEEWNPIHVPRDKSSFQLSRLDNSMTYEVRLAAYNEHGRGEFSSALAFTTTERETNIGFRSSEEDVPFYFRHYFVLPVAASVVVIVTTVVFAWVCYKRVVFRQHRHLVLQQQLAGHLPDGQLTIHRDGYIRPPTYSPPSTRHGVVTSTSIVGILNPEDGYDAPWDVKKAQQQQQQQQPHPPDPQSGSYTRLKNRPPSGEIRRLSNTESSC
ncbi:Down syndrome cell adhesion molecule-like protein Dscam2 [Stegodyphus dumicola]|uniref:Down syndrome cell adhesion molecule-like protein Dscam2 n=1 Tax=Stegodyphus dumicola TaxID=202533 RepID=UPI0015AC8A04|nr:Down syndrome cell adhesion molecule-like protein Dscam2 [Stegodyphus dumicola]